MNEVKVSVIIPVYNAEQYLSECIESVLSQTYKNIEIICVDDGSTDKSAELIKSFQKIDKRIRLIQQTNQYAGVARNHGFDVSEGEYVIFLDADDYFDQFLVEKMLFAIYEKDADIAICGSQGFDDKLKKEHRLSGALNLELLPENDIFSKMDIQDHIFQLTAGWAWDKMYRARFLKEKKLRFQNIKASEDELFVDLAFGEAKSITTVKEVLITHRTNVAFSLEDRKDQFWYCGYEMLSAERMELEKRGLFPMLEKSFVNRAAGYITWNACSITTPVYFSEFYSHFRKKAIKELGISGYPPDYYDDPFAYEIIRKIEQCDEKEFLCDRIKELNQIVTDRDLYIQELLSCIQKSSSDLERLIERMKWMQGGKRWILPDGLPKGSRIIMYGFGDVGSDWYEDFQRVKDVELVMVVDRNYKNFEVDAVKVHPAEDIKTIEYDYILIAINEKEIADEVKASLIKQGILPDKLLWFDPAERAAG